MNETRTNPFFRLMPSLTDVAFLLPVIFLFGKLDGMRTLLGDGDTGWHVRTGEWILAHHRVPTVDIFSFTKPGEPWFAWEWLWDVAFAWIHKFAGLGGVALVSMAVICLTSALLFRLVYRRCGNPLIAIGLTALADAAASIHWLARPHLFTMLFMVVFLGILDRVSSGKAEEKKLGRRVPSTKLLLLLPVLTVLWTNIHGGFFLGIILVGTYGAGELVRALISPDREERMEAIRSAMPYLYTAMACAAVTLVNPYGYHLHQHIFEYLGDPYQAKYVDEFQGTNFQAPSAQFMEVMMVLAAGAAIWFAFRKQFTEAILIAGFGHMGLIAVRNIPIFVIAAAPIAGLPLVEWLKNLSAAPLVNWAKNAGRTLLEIGEEMIPMERLWRLHIVSVLVFAAVILGVHAPNPGWKFRPEYSSKAYPKAALSVLGPDDRIFADDEWGDYLAYKRFPTGGKVFVDGRSDFYGATFDHAYINTLGAKYGWQDTLDCYGVNTILLRVGAPLSEVLKESKRWRVTYDDGVAIVFRPANEQRIEQFSTGNSSGAMGGRDFSVSGAVTGAKNVNLKDHVITEG